MTVARAATGPHSEIARRRLQNQHIGRAALEEPAEVVGWLGAVQAQDYPAAKWALGLRLRGATDETIERAFAEGRILRTHVLRPTWHFVAPADIRWLLALTGPRVHAATAARYRQLGLDAALLARGEAALSRALGGGQHATRAELAEGLQAAGVATTDPPRLTHVLMHAELEGLICSGPRRGKEFTYALLEERVPPARTLDREEALAELARRYFASHGPATVQDFVWWAGLTVSDARTGIQLADPSLASAVLDGKTYWCADSTPAAKRPDPTAYLLPNFDEYVVGYRDRSAVFDAAHIPQLDSWGNVLFHNTVVLDGQIVGTWKRSFGKSLVNLTISPFTAWGEAGRLGIIDAAVHYSQFLRMGISLPTEVLKP